MEYDIETGEPTNVFYKHTYTATLTTEATCQQTGLRTLTCTAEGCGHVTTETVPVNTEIHTWDDGVTDPTTGIITYTCTCGHTKTAVDASAAISKEALAAADELKVGDNLDVSISMDNDTVEALTGDISIRVSVADESATNGLSDAQKDQIGDNLVYDFSMSDDNGNVSSFEGLVTVSLPYTLQDGDDVDCIDVWFIADDGTVTIQQGTYSNGYVTFVTNHFSYYTVTQLTPEERCHHYGHTWKEMRKEPTCSSNGYSMEVCQRCKAEQNIQTFEMLTHAFVLSEEDSRPATCTTNGMEVMICSHCGAAYRTTLFALGHNMVVTESVAATCTEAGREVKTCANGCGVTQTVQFPALGHNHQYTETVAATCTTKCYEVYTCSCGDTLHRNEQPAYGHSYEEAENGWFWNDDLTAATVTLVCSHDSSHTTTQKAVVSEVAKAASCTASGTTTYTAKVTYNNVSYENVQYTEQSATGHATASEEWQTTAAKHYRTCDTCGIRIDQADHHWGGAEITESPNCVSAGKATYACTVCGYSRQEIIPATSIHTDTDADGSCDICGFREETCTHELTAERLIDLSGYNVCEGTRILEVSCECGKETDYAIDQLVCTWGEETTTYEKELANGKVMTVNVSTCQDCGIVLENGVTWLPIEGSCELDNTNYEKLTIGGEVIFERETHDTVMMGHDLNVTLEEKTITADGFCGADILIVGCSCGDWVADDSSYNCQWADIEIGNDTDKYVCTVCGAVRSVVYSTENDGCTVVNRGDHTLEYNGEVLHSAQTYFRMVVHDFKLENYVMDGDTCEDGVLLTYKCAECGEINEYYTTAHELNTSSVTDVQDWNNPCMTEIQQDACVCGARLEYYTVSDRSCDYPCHEWHSIREEGNTTVYACQNCGYTKTTVRTASEKNDNCEATVLYTDTISDGGEHSITLSRTESVEAHNFITTRTLLGESCEDGVRVEEICQDCGYHNQDYTYDYHGGVLIDSLNLSEFGGCNTRVEQYQCVCGQDAWWGTSEKNCNWEHKGVENGFDIYVCTNCGITRKNASKHLGTDGCIDSYLNTVSFLKNGRTIKTFSFTNHPSSHQYIYELTLHEGATSCADGYDVKGTCLKCGHTYESRNYHGCETWLTERVVSPDGVFCGNLIVEHTSCACGKHISANVYRENGDCNFIDYIDEETGESVRRCEYCGIEMGETVEEFTPLDPVCYYLETRTESYYRDGQCVFTVAIRNTFSEHDWIATYQTGEGFDKCEDGYTVCETCAVCGVSIGYEGNDCAARPVAKVLAVSRDDICGDIYRYDHSCACGANSFATYVMPCNFVEDGIDEETGAQKYRCTECPMHYDVLITDSPVPGTTCQISTNRIAHYYVGDELLFAEESTSTETRHTEEYCFELLGRDCDDGYYVSTVCSKCGEALWRDEEVRYGCSTYSIWDYSTPYFVDAGACGTYYKVNDICACGKTQYTRLVCENWRCNMEWIDKIDGEQCSTCGLTRKSNVTSVENDRENCIASNREVQTYSMNGVQLGEFQAYSQWSSHTWLHSYELHGETCRDGYTENLTCYFCQKQTTNERVPSDDEPEFICAAHLVNLVPVLEREDICSNVYAGTGCCACGNEKFTSWYYDCNFGEYLYDEETSSWYKQCSDCGLVEKHYIETVYDPENCTATDLTHYTFYMNGTECGTYTSEQIREYHFTTATFDLQGDSCEDGYYVIHHCRYCDYSRTEEEIRYGHDTFETTAYDLSGVECCGIKLSRTACPCGLIMQYGWETTCCFNWTEETDPDGYNLYVCDTCGLQYTNYGTDGAQDIVNCTFSNTQNFRFYRNGELLQAVEFPYRSYSHHYVMTDAVLNDPDLGCEGGYTITMQCPYCMDAYTETCEAGEADHGMRNTDILFVELEGGCHTAYAIGNCACGQESALCWYYDECDYEENNETVVIDGISHNLRTRTCTVCGFVITEDSYDETTDDPCKIITHQEITYRYGDKVMTCVGSDEHSIHDLYAANAELMEGNTNCEQGVMVTYACTKCDYTESREEYGHFTYADETHDLEAYGSVHGGELAHFVCACGNISRYDFRNMTCDLDRTEIDNFVAGAIDDTWSETAEGSTWIDSEAFLIKCAVTDPQCGLTVRMSEYWLADEATCIATEYQIWELGYDEFFGTCQKTIVVPTGNTATYHSYVPDESTEYEDDGTQITTRRETCSVCSSSYVHRYEYYPDGSHRNFIDVVNNLNNGKAKERHEYWYYDRVISGYSYLTEQYSEYVYANGENHWFRHVYLFESDDPCYYTEIYTSYRGENSTHNDWMHQTIQDWIEESTCSQHGRYVFKCALCGNTEAEIYEEIPRGHYWEYDYALNCYRCYHCGLKNSNGADGSIVLENLSDAGRYIVGYWNKESISFAPRAAVVKYNTASGEEEVVLLDGIDIGYLTEEEDGTVAVAMDKIQVDEAVAAQLEGYEGGYAVRVIFVPSNDQSIMDYALTFDTCYTAGWVESTEATESAA